MLAASLHLYLGWLLASYLGGVMTIGVQVNKNAPSLFIERTDLKDDAGHCTPIL